jgi:hypothetical protein
MSCRNNEPYMVPWQDPSEYRTLLQMGEGFTNPVGKGFTGRKENYNNPTGDASNYAPERRTWANQSRYSLEEQYDVIRNKNFMNYAKESQTWAPQKEYSLEERFQVQRRDTDPLNYLKLKGTWSEQRRYEL